MKLATAKIENFLNNPDKHIRAVLFYGPDIGLVSVQSKRLMQKIVPDLSDPFLVTYFEFDKIKSDPALLADEVSAVSMLGGRRLIKVNDATASIDNKICQAMLDAKTDTMVVFEAGELGPGSSLRKSFEDHPNFVAIACYKDDAASIREVLKIKFRNSGYIIEDEALKYLIHNFGGDRLVILSEAEKLMTYMGNDKNITLDVAMQCITDSRESSFDDLTNAVASRNQVEIQKNLQRVFAENVGAIAPIRAILRYMYRLREVLFHIDNGMSLEVAMTKLAPPVFFKQVPIFKSHLRIWNNKSIDNVVDSLLRLETDCKQTGSNPELLLARFLCLVK